MKWLRRLFCRHNWLSKRRDGRVYAECEYCLKTTEGVDGWPL